MNFAKKLRIITGTYAAVVLLMLGFPDRSRAVIITFVEDASETLTVEQVPAGSALCLSPGMMPPFREFVICSGMLPGVGLGGMPRPPFRGRVKLVEPGTDILSDLVTIDVREGVILTFYDITFQSDPFNPVPDTSELIGLDETRVFDISEDFRNSMGNPVLLPPGLTVRVRLDAEVPAPHTLLLFGSGILGLIVTRTVLRRLPRNCSRRGSV